jgi:hypothetical protein
MSYGKGRCAWGGVEGDGGIIYGFRGFRKQGD